MKGEEICNQRLCTRTDRACSESRRVARKQFRFGLVHPTLHSLSSTSPLCSFLLIARRFVERIESRNTLYYGRKHGLHLTSNTLASRMIFLPTKIRARASLKVTGLPKAIHNPCPPREPWPFQGGEDLATTRTAPTFNAKSPTPMNDIPVFFSLSDRS